MPITGGIVQYVVYYDVSPGQVQVVNIMTTNGPFHPSDGEAFLEQYLAENTEALESDGFKVLEPFRDVTVAGRAFAIVYRITIPRGGADYSIILPLTYPDGTGLIIQWGSSEDLASQTRDTFVKMVPTISLTPWSRLTNQVP